MMVKSIPIHFHIMERRSSYYQWRVRGHEPTPKVFNILLLKQLEGKDKTGDALIQHYGSNGDINGGQTIPRFCKVSKSSEEVEDVLDEHIVFRRHGSNKNISWEMEGESISESTWIICKCMGLLVNWEKGGNGTQMELGLLQLTLCNVPEIFTTYACQSFVVI